MIFRMTLPKIFGTTLILILQSHVPGICGYDTGPLVGDRKVCDHMTPTGHGASTQPIGESPFEIVTNTEGCYKEGLPVQGW